MNTHAERDVRPLVDAFNAEVAKELKEPPTFYHAIAIIVPATGRTEAEAKRAAVEVTIPEGFQLEREPDGTPEVWGQDLFAGTYWVLYVKRS
jgi:hypothetical protein